MNKNKRNELIWVIAIDFQSAVPADTDWTVEELEDCAKKFVAHYQDKDEKRIAQFVVDHSYIAGDTDKILYPNYIIPRALELCDIADKEGL